MCMSSNGVIKSVIRRVGIGLGSVLGSGRDVC